MRDKITIYKDKDLKIEVDRNFHSLLQKNKPTTFILDSQEFDMIAQMALNLIAQDKIKIKKPSLIRNIPLIRAGYSLGLSEPYDYFNDILGYIAMYPSLDEDYLDIEKDINECFKEEGLRCYLFPHRVFDVKGFIVKEEEDQKVILLFGFENNTQNIDFLDYF